MNLATYVLAAAVVLIPAFAQQTPQEVTVDFLNQGEPDSLDPNRASPAFGAEAAVVRQVFEPLLRFDDKLIPQPAAASSYDISPDGTLVTFHLRQDGRWSDGQPVTASQFEYSWKRILDPGLKAEYAPLFVDAGIVGADAYNSGKVATPDKVGVRALDDATLEVQLNQSFGALPDLAALPVGSPLRADIVGADLDGWAQAPATVIGNGPFMLSEWVHQDHITLVQNPEYVAHLNWPKPTLTRATLLMVTNPEADYAAFVNNKRDWTVVPDADLNVVLNDPDLAPLARQYTELATFWVQINTARQPLSNVYIRKALAKGIDRQALVRDIAASISVPMTSVIPPGMPGFQDSLGQELGFDPNGARALLAQAGFPDGQGFADLTFSFPATTANARRAEYLQAQWRTNLGIDVQLNSMDSNDYQQALKDNNYDLAFAGWVADYPDPQDWFNPVFGCKAPYNNTNYCKPSFDQLVARADAATSLNQRLLEYNQAQALLVQDAPVVPLFARGHLALVKPWIQATNGGPLPITAQDEYPGSLFLDSIQVSPH